MTKKIAVIPARGGSKRIPKKNIIDFCGKPMITWTIEAALHSGCFDRVIVSTDSEEIAKISTQCGCPVPFLRKTAMDEYSPVSLATIAAVQQASEFYQETYDVVAQLMPNCPLRGAHDVKRAVMHFQGNQAPFQISCFQYGFMNPWWAFRMEEGGRGKFIFEKAVGRRSQDLEKLFCPTGAIWLAHWDALVKANTFYGPEHVFFPLLWSAGLDIDNYDDLRLAEAVARTFDHAKEF